MAKIEKKVNDLLESIKSLRASVLIQIPGYGKIFFSPTEGDKLKLQEEMKLIIQSEEMAREENARKRSYELLGKEPDKKPATKSTSYIQ